MTDMNIVEKTGPQLVAEYNGLVARATGMGLTGYREVTRFMDRESAEKRIAALESSIRAREAGGDFEATESELSEQAPRPKNHTEPSPEEDTIKAMIKATKAMKKIKAKMKKLAKPKSEKKPPRSTRSKTNGNGHNSKTAEVGRLLKRKGGCTRTDILAATGWTQVSVPAMAEACGLTLRQERTKGELTRYWGE